MKIINENISTNKKPIYLFGEDGIIIYIGKDKALHVKKSDNEPLEIPMIDNLEETDIINFQKYLSDTYTTLSELFDIQIVNQGNKKGIFAYAEGVRLC